MDAIELLSKHDLTNTSALTLANVTKLARVVDVQDGDSMTVVVELYPGGVHVVKVRLFGVDTWELNSADPTKRDLAVRARARTVELMTGDVSGPGTTSVRAMLAAKPCFVTLHGRGYDKYGRSLCSVTNQNGVDVARVLIDEGLGVVYKK